MPSRRLKLRMRPHSYKLLCDIDQFIGRFDYRGKSLREAASDCLDGGSIRAEVDDLVRRRLLSIVRLDDGLIEPDSLCGTNWTVQLTPRAIHAFWADRLSRPPAMTGRHPTKMETRPS